MAAAGSCYVIVGAGIFGVSTAYHLIRRYPEASVTLVDRDAFDADNRVAASWDWNKVMRADYDDPVYCELALEAQDVFTSDPLWKPFFHQTGLYWMCGRDYARGCVSNFERLGRHGDISVWPVEEARKLFGGLFDESDYTNVEQVLVNRASGWVAAGDCLQAVTRRVLGLGVKYVAEEVANLQFDPSGRCAGIETAQGRRLPASHVVLCTGASTPKLLEISAAASGLTNLQAGSRILAGGITTGMTRLDDDSYAKFADMPVGIQGYTTLKGNSACVPSQFLRVPPFMGSLPPTKDRELKWWGQKIFRNTKEVLPGRFISMPPAEADYAQWKISERLKEDIVNVSSVFYGNQAAKWKFEKHRICWDAFTTSSDFIISPHTASKGLYVATCGSFHGYKFFPVIGRYVVDMLEDTLPARLASKWAWDRERPDPSANPDWPSCEMKDLLDPVRDSRL
ncbi:sarcosine oxidase [Metarhizium album ARSEF 1941]|uniref:Sarcosine oxidase n=1 Tax=Metarhizium album (strain ARSEF 1941) TaxID=1081103 RepID=A0A0B2WZU6_METAS|nr:sarcosine oxidase [Metarhizium album ARSEF 1941]KHN98355.1 sarcosine oxidase [Metarhizium album ARSEF 1941]